MEIKLLSISEKPGQVTEIPANPAPDVVESASTMGTVFEILIYGSDRRNLSAAARQALREIVNLDDQLSRWKSGTDIAYINAHAAKERVRVEPELFDLLLRSRRIWSETNGAFDITVAPLVKAWGFYEKKGRLPGSEETKSALEIVGMEHVVFDEEERTIFFERSGMEIDLGGIGKGYAVDRAVEILEACEVKAALVNSGTSSMYAIGSPPGQEWWHIGIRNPKDEEKSVATLALKDGSVSTSGAPEKVFEVAGKKYSHIIDPRSGRPAEGSVSATAIVGSAAESDALATAFYVLRVAGTRAYWEKHADVKAILIPATDEGKKPAVVAIGFDRNESTKRDK